MNYITQQMLGYHLSLYQQSIETRNPGQIDDFFKKFLTRFELVTIIEWLLDGVAIEHINLDKASLEDLWEIIGDDKIILQYYLSEWELTLQQSTIYSSEEVRKVLDRLQSPTHYLAEKSIKEWDPYDHSNYRNILIKAGRLKRVYGIYDSEIKQEQINTVTTPPLRYFESYTDAEKALEELIRYQSFMRKDLHILYSYVPI